MLFRSDSARLSSSQKPAKECRSIIRNAADLVRRLTIEFEIELGLGSAVLPVRKRFELAPPQTPLRAGSPSDSDTHTRRLPRNPALHASIEELDRAESSLNVEALVRQGIDTLAIERYRYGNGLVEKVESFKSATA